MEESKIVATERLRREERWEEASRFKDATLREMRSSGMTKVEASDAAWSAMLEKYPPLPSADPPVDQQVAELAARPVEHIAPGDPAEAAGIDTLLERLGDNGADLPRDVLWVYDNLENRRARPEDAPSLGAWSLLKWVREYRSRFFEVLLPKALAVKEKQKEEASASYADMGLEDVSRMLGEFDRQFEESLAKNVPRVVQTKVCDMVSEWRSCHGLEVSAEAVERLGRQMVHVVADCIRAVHATPERFSLSPDSGAEAK